MKQRVKKVYIFKGEANASWYWNLRATNGKVIADGGEGYIRRAQCIKSMCVSLGLDEQHVSDIVAEHLAGDTFRNLTSRWIWVNGERQFENIEVVVA